MIDYIGNIANCIRIAVGIGRPFKTHRLSMLPNINDGRGNPFGIRRNANRIADDIVVPEHDSHGVRTVLVSA